MLIDLINPACTITANLKLAQVVGLQAAVYCNELLTLYRKAYFKEKLVDGDYFKIDRDYVHERTTLTIEEQLKCDLNLIKVNVIKKHNEDPDIIKVDADLLASIIASEDVKLLKDISKKVVSNPKGIKESKRQIIIKGLKDGIVCSNYELLTALRGWVDAIYSKPNGFLSKSAIEAFQNKLNTFTQGDLDLALKIVEIATIQAWKECDWAINSYNKSKQMQSTSGPRVTVQQKADKDDLSNIIF